MPCVYLGKTYKAFNDKNQYVLVTYEGKYRKKNRYGDKYTLVKVQRVGNSLIKYLPDIRVLFRETTEDGTINLYVKCYNQKFIIRDADEREE